MHNASRPFLVVAVLIALTACQSKPDFRRSGEQGAPTTPSHGWKSQKGDAPQPADTPCGRTQFTFGVVQDVACSATFDFNPLVLQLTAQRDAWYRSIACPKRCENRTVWNNALITTCERENTRARARLEAGLLCSANPQNVPSLTIPPTGPIGPSREFLDFPWQSHGHSEETLISGGIACDDVIQLEYREKAVCANIRTFAPYVQEAYRQAVLRHPTLPCAQGCKRRPGPAFVFSRWNCANDMVLVEVQFKSCER